MTRPEIIPLDEEREFALHELFFSTTDKKGIIRHGNEVFARISGYAEDELIGAAHNLIRHPDMPRCVFQLLWDYIEAGKTIAAYVKNLAKDGRYYWVFATVMPCPGGYLSIRLKPSSGLLTTVKELYRETLSVERRVETSPSLRKQAIQAGVDHISGAPQELGFAKYDNFMWHALSTEIASRQATLKGRSFGYGSGTRPSDPSAVGTCRRVETHLQRLFGALDQFRSLNEKLVTSSTAIMDMADAIYTLSLNATIAAYQTGQIGSILAVAAEELGGRTADNEQIIRRLAGKMKEFAPKLGDLIFNVAVAKLQSEVCCFYIEEVMSATSQEVDERVSASLRILLDELSVRSCDLTERLKACEHELAELAMSVGELKRNAQALRFVQFAGIKEAQQQQNSEEFAVVFREVREQIQRTKDECEDLDHEVSSRLAMIRTIRRDDTSMVNDLTRLKDLCDRLASEHPSSMLAC